MRARIVASAHLLDTPFSDMPDQSPWTLLKRDLDALDTAIRAAVATVHAAGVQAGREAAEAYADRIVGTYERAHHGDRSDEWWKGWDTAVDTIKGAIHYGASQDTPEGGDR